MSPGPGAAVVLNNHANVEVHLHTLVSAFNVLESIQHDV